MNTLRERNKQNRRARILDCARRHFLERGFEETTIEMIAAHAEVSAVTVYNYYRTKGGLLLALLIRCARTLLDEVSLTPLPQGETALEALCRFSADVNDHALYALDRATWRHAIAAGLLEGGLTFREEYADISNALKALWQERATAGNHRQPHDGRTDEGALGDLLYYVHGARFVQFVTAPSMSRATLDARLRKDYALILGAPGNPSESHSGHKHPQSDNIVGR